MKNQSILNKIIKMEGTGKIENDILEGRIGKYTIKHRHEDDYFTATKDGTQYDPGSDYNPSGALFYSKVKDLEFLIK